MAQLDPCFVGIAGISAVEGEPLVPLGAEYPIYDEFREWAKDAPFKTTPELFLHAWSISKDRPYLGQRVNGKFEFETYDQIYQKILCFASALSELGLAPGDRVANFSNNRPEWPIVDFGCGFAACVHVPMYPTLSQSELAFIIKDSGAKMVVVATEEHLRKVLSIEASCPDLEHIVFITPVQSIENCSKHMWSWHDLIEYGRVRLRKHNDHIKYLLSRLQPTDVASLVYTSGTTGDPKGAMLMHGNFCSQAYLLQDRLDANKEDSELSFLPLSHVFERAVHYLYTSVGACIAYTQGMHSIMTDLVDFKPTIFPCVPIFFDKLYNRLMERPDLRTGPSLKWAIKVGRSYSAAQRAGRVSRVLAAQQAMARMLVGKEIQKRYGGRIRYLISGGAPLRAEVAKFFWDMGVKILEGYGLTETSPVIALNPKDAPRYGSVGKEAAGATLAIDDGEIVVRGPNIMRGYYKHPEETAAALDAQGWFHTGDVGFLDDGYLTITDRKKCLIVLANGKNVAPAGIEQLLCRSKWIERAVLVGDNAQHVAALIVPDFNKLKEWAEERKLEGDAEEWVKNEELKNLIMGEVRTACAHLSNYEKVKRIAIMPRDFSVAAGEMTHSMKVKHRVIEENYASIIKSLLA